MASFAPLVIHENERPVDGWDDDEHGRVSWRTLFSAGTTPTEALTCGMAILDHGGELKLHWHEPPEIYFGIEGTVRVVIGGETHRLAPGVAMFIPGGAIHGVFADNGPARFFYAFARDSFDSVVYNFIGDDVEPVIEVPGAVATVPAQIASEFPVTTDEAPAEAANDAAQDIERPA